MSSNAPAQAAGPREWIGLAVLVLPVLLLALDNSVLFLAAPQLAADLRPDSTELLWILDIYGFMIAGFLVTMGGLADRIGPRRLLLGGAAAFGLASVLAAYAPTPESLIAARALLGVAAATMMPSTLSLTRELFHDPRQRALAIGIWTACFSGGTIIGPVVGGVLLQWFWWGSVFLLGVPVMALLLVSLALLPDPRRDATGTLDLLGVVFSLAAVLPIIYALKELAYDGPRPHVIAAAIVGLAFAVLFVRRQRRLTHPLLDLKLFHNRSFTAALGILLTGMAIVGGVYLFITQYLQLVAGLTPLQAGLWSAPAAVAEMAVAVLAPLLARRIRPAYVVGTGLLMSAAGLGMLTQVDANTGLPTLIAGVVILFAGTSPMMTLSTDIVIGAAPPQRAGSAASMLETSGELGVAIGVAGFGSLGTAVYASQMSDAIPESVPPSTADLAGSTLANALAAAGQLPAAVGDQLVDAARAAFVNGLNTMAGISAFIAVGLAVLTFGVLRHQRTSTAAAETPEVHTPDAALHSDRSP